MALQRFQGVERRLSILQGPVFGHGFGLGRLVDYPMHLQSSLSALHTVPVVTCWNLDDFVITAVTFDSTIKVLVDSRFV